MSDFGAFTSTSDTDPTADFLARERAALGDDAELFGAISTESSAFPDVNALSARPTSASSSFMDMSVTSRLSPPPAADYSVFDKEFPAAEDLEQSEVFAKARSPLPEIEPEVVRQWRERQATLIEERDAESQKKTDETKQKAREAIDKFYEDYNEKKQKAIEANRRQEEDYLVSRSDTTSGTVWERVVKEIDTINPKSNKNQRDTSRMKNLMLDLKKDPKAPGTFIEV